MLHTAHPAKLCMHASGVPDVLPRNARNTALPPACPLTLHPPPARCPRPALQLCTQRYTPPHGNYGQLWPFVMCQAGSFRDVGRAPLFERCLKHAGYGGTPQQAQIESCLGSSEADGLLAASAAHTAKRGVTKSCTVHIAGAQRCIMDMGQWYDCPGGSEADDFVRSVCEAYHQGTGTWPEQECGAAPLPDTGAPLQA